MTQTHNVCPSPVSAIIAKGIVIALALVAACSSPAVAIDTATAYARIKLAVICTDNKTCTDKEEQKKIYDAGAEMIKEEKDANKKIRGVGAINGTFPDSITGFRVEILPPGTATLLSFRWADPTLDLQPTTGPTIASVHYEYSHTLDPGTFTPLGISTDASSNFSLPYSSFSTEQAIMGIPYDVAGAPIFIADIDGIGNIAPSVVVNLVPDLVPEPSTASLVGVTLCAMLYRRRLETAGSNSAGE
jgi:hypothetical protein